MAKRKPIKVRYGDVKKLAVICRVSQYTVHKALSWQSDTEVQNLVRQRAKELDMIRKF
jgi:hypothetical protein